MKNFLGPNSVLVCSSSSHFSFVLQSCKSILVISAWRERTSERMSQSQELAFLLVLSFFLVFVKGGSFWGCQVPTWSLYLLISRSMYIFVMYMCLCVQSDLHFLSKRFLLLPSFLSFLHTGLQERQEVRGKKHCAHTLFNLYFIMFRIWNGCT